MKNKISLYSVLIMSIALSACQTGYNNQGASGVNTYSSKDVNIAKMTDIGVILAIQDAFIENQPNLIATLGGAVAGGLIGSTIGKGSGNTIAKVVGAVAGGSVANQAVQGSVRKVKQITFKSDYSRQLYTVVQDDRYNVLHVGQKVLLQRDGRTIKVQPY